MSKEVSTLEYLSNIQPIDTTISNDTTYMTFVHDPFALEQIQKLIEVGRISKVMTGIQAKEMQNASGHCAFAFKGDYPWGTVIVDGQKKVVCKCINQECSFFSQCRKGLSTFSELELETDHIGKKVDEEAKDILISFKQRGVEFKEKLLGTDKISDDEITEYIEIDDEDIEADENADTSNDDEGISTNSNRNLENEFRNWLYKDGFFENVVDKYIGNLREYSYLLELDNMPSIFEEVDIARLDEVVRKYESKLNGPKYRAVMKYYRKFIAEVEPAASIQEQQEPMSKEKEKPAVVETPNIKRDSTEPLKEFKEWMLQNDYKKATADGYVSAIKSANSFAKKKEILTEDILDIDSFQIINDFADKLEKSPFFKPSMSYYVTALRVFGKYCKSVNETEIEIVDFGDNESNTSCDIQNDAKENEDIKEGFEKFDEVSQDNVIFANVSDRIIVNAGPGTGKTYTLIEKLVYMVNEELIDPEEILVLCFSRAAVEVIEKRLQAEFDEGKVGLNWHSIDIRTFDSFATHLLAYVQENEKELLYDGFSLDYLDYNGRIKAATDVVKKSKELIEQCGHLIVDEVQDLVADRAMFVMQLIKSLQDESGYTLLGDACQSIYDYQIQHGETDSIKFYSWLFNNQNKSKFYSFVINYRQVSELESLGNEYRNTILIGDDKSRKSATNNVFAKVEELPNIDFKTAGYQELLDIFGDKSVCILTRTNGQALKISTWFRNAGIPHKVQKRLTDNSLNMWIANVFRDYENDTIDQMTFDELYQEKGDICFDADKIWSEMEKTQYEAKERYYVKDLLAGILNNSKTKEFYTSSGEDQITISNIHRSKGREFEEIVLLDDTLFMDVQEQKDLMEHKVTYVAITRAKEKIYRTSIGTQYIKTDKIGERRSYATGLGFRKKKPYLSHLEIGRNYDFEMTSFAETYEIQKKFDDPLLLVGERVKLIKNIKYSKEIGYISYDILLEDEMFFGRIGRTSKKFYLDLKRILKDVNNLQPDKDVYPEIYPSRFSEIYIEDVISVISAVNPKAVAGKKYGDIMIWKGISVAGLAQIEKDTY